MIKYALKCSHGHSFESWFQSSGAYEKLSDSGMLSCAVCGSSDVTKAIMAPRVKSDEDPEKPLSAPASTAEQYLSELRAHVEANSDHVGKDFASEARKIHDGEAPARAIYGEASLRDVKSLVDDNIPVAPLPWKKRDVN